MPRPGALLSSIPLNASIRRRTARASVPPVRELEASVPPGALRASVRDTDIRITEQDEPRITEGGDQRIINDLDR